MHDMHQMISKNQQDTWKQTSLVYMFTIFDEFYVSALINA